MTSRQKVRCQRSAPGCGYFWTFCLDDALSLRFRPLPSFPRIISFPSSRIRLPLPLYSSTLPVSRILLCLPFNSSNHPFIHYSPLLPFFLLLSLFLISLSPFSPSAFSLFNISPSPSLFFALPHYRIPSSSFFFIYLIISFISEVYI